MSSLVHLLKVILLTVAEVLPPNGNRCGMGGFERQSDFSVFCESIFSSANYRRSLYRRGVFLLDHKPKLRDNRCLKVVRPLWVTTAIKGCDEAGAIGCCVCDTIDGYFVGSL